MSNDALRAIRERHEADKKDTRFERYANQAYADRATLLRALDEAQERAERAEAALRPFADRPWVELLSDDLSPNHLISMDARVGDLRRAAQTLKERHDG